MRNQPIGPIDEALLKAGGCSIAKPGSKSSTMMPGFGGLQSTTSNIGRGSRDSPLLSSTTDSSRRIPNSFRFNDRLG
ncbi:MAG: hypothetical protein F4227_05715 [Gammaproteobacteria bacterium]|nr:hypothetical protein [Gammaproteobacteria bacterium]MYF02463.1 hypothetical protein [Gammaproteobacteria bacterium]MYI77888.1 hypothetical protein [Gammaproteobacteria bacterium]